MAIPEKARLLEKLKSGGFKVPDFIYVPAEDFRRENLDDLEVFFKGCRDCFKVIARSGHPKEEYFKGGTFDSLETYADVGGIVYARKRMINFADTANRLSIMRQQKFNNAPEIEPEEMGVIVMPFIDGTSVMAKELGDSWEFGYCRDRVHKVKSEPYITRTPHDRRLLQLSEDIQKYLGFRCEIEYIVATDGEIFVVQAKDISHIETLEMKESERSIKLDSIRRIRKRRSYRERPIYVMDTRAFYINVISRCEDMVLGCRGPAPSVEDIIRTITDYEQELENFTLRYERFGVLGLSVEVPEVLNQVANHYLDDTPELQKKLSQALHSNAYKIDFFLSEADTLIAKENIRLNMCSHDAYGIDTVRNPLWSVYWLAEKNKEVVKKFRALGFRTGDFVGIDIDSEEKPTIYRL